MVRQLDDFVIGGELGEVAGCRTRRLWPALRQRVAPKPDQLTGAQAMPIGQQDSGGVTVGIAVA